MAKMSQKELLEEGFSDKIRGIAKAGVAGIKQAAAQGVHLDTGQLAKGMHKAYKGEQPIAVLKKYLENNPKIDIVKINKGGIKKQQANKSKGYFGRITGPKSVILIPFTGTLLGKHSEDKGREYEGASAGEEKKMSRILASVENTSNYVIKEARAYMDDSRSETGGYAPINKSGPVKKQIFDFMVKSGVSEEGAKTFTKWAGKNMKSLLKYITDTHPNIKFTYKGKPELGVTDFPDEERVDVTEGLSLKDIIQLSREVLIVEKRELSMDPKNVRRRELARQKREAAKKAKEADPTGALPEYYKEKPEPEPAVEEPVAEPGKKAEADFDEVTAAGYKKFIKGLDDEVIKGLLKTLQVAQPGYRIKFEEEKKQKQELQPSDHTEQNFVAEIFRVGKGLQVGDIYREDDPTKIIIPGGTGSEVEKKEVKLSPFDKAVQTLTTKNNLTADTLATTLTTTLKPKEGVNIIDKIVSVTGKDKSKKLLDTDIEKIKAVLIKDRVMKEGTSQKVLLRQLTLLSR